METYINANIRRFSKVKFEYKVCSHTVLLHKYGVTYISVNLIHFRPSTSSTLSLLKVASMVVTWWIVSFFAQCYLDAMGMLYTGLYWDGIFY